jgi:hypothetical protein
MMERPRRRPSFLRALVLALAGATLVAAFAQLGIASSKAAPTNSLRPTIAGDAREGSTLTAYRGNWRNSPTSFAYQWLRCNSAGGACASIANATNLRYTATSADVGLRLRVRVTASNKDGSSSATSNATAVVRPAGSGPVSRSAPVVTGATVVGSTLSASNGSWRGTTPIRYAYQWQRCDETGGSCGDIAGATAKTYVLSAADVGRRMRVRVTASNSRGSASAFSGATDLVAPAGGTGGPAISVANVNPPQRLIVDKLQFIPSVVRSRRPFTARFRVSDTRGFLVRDALVYVLGLPYGQIRTAAEVQTDSTGWATFTLRPTTKLNLRSRALVMFVRARKPGDNLLAGVSTRRLVQLTLAPG